MSTDVIHLYARPLSDMRPSDNGPRTETWCGEERPEEQCTSHVELATCTECLIDVRRNGLTAERRLRELRVDYTYADQDILIQLAERAREFGVDVVDLRARLSDALDVMTDHIWGHGAPDWWWMALALLPPAWQQEIRVVRETVRPDTASVVIAPHSEQPGALIPTQDNENSGTSDVAPEVQ